MIDMRTNAEHHAAAARELGSAIAALKRAVKAEDDLDFGPTLEGLLSEVERVKGRLEEYAKNGW